MIGARIRELRKQKHMSLSQLAERSTVTKSYLSNIERNICINPTIDVIQKVANGLGIDPSILVEWEESIKTLDIVDDPLTYIKKMVISMDNIELKELQDYIEFTVWTRKQISSGEVNNRI